MKHEIFLNGNTAVCPECSGMLRLYLSTTGYQFRCNDCSSVYKVVSQSSHQERILLCRKIHTGFKKKKVIFLKKMELDQYIMDLNVTQLEQNIIQRHINSYKAISWQQITRMWRTKKILCIEYKLMDGSLKWWHYSENEYW